MASTESKNMQRVDWFSSDGEWWIVHDPANGNDDFELIHLPTREDGGDGSEGSFPTYEEAVARAEWGV